MTELIPSIHRPRIAEVRAVVAQQFGLSIAEMNSPARARYVARPRQLAMYLARELTGKSTLEIGRAFGDRDHTTVLHATRSIEEIRRRDSEYNEAIALCSARLARLVAERMTHLELDGCE